MGAVIFVILAIIASYQTDKVHGIIGGERAAQGEFPFMVSLRSSSHTHFCGGTIIGPKWILTANSCYSRSFFGYARIGSVVLDDGNPDEPLSVKIKEAFYNPHAWDREPYNHDLVLVELEEAIAFNDTVYPVKLADNETATPFNQQGVIVGWGAGWGLNDKYLMKANVTLFDDLYCKRHERGYWFQSSMMNCAGNVNNTVGQCYGDYGGPFMINGVQWGLLSYFLPPCASAPGVISPIHLYRDWIREKTGI